MITFYALVMIQLATVGGWDKANPLKDLSVKTEGISIIATYADESDCEKARKLVQMGADKRSGMTCVKVSK